MKRTSLFGLLALSTALAVEAGTLREGTNSGPLHWSLAPLTRPPVPAGAAHPIDAFIRARLASRGVASSPQADPRSLARRVAYDLTGLPPTPEEVEAFCSDPDPAAAYGRLIDRLLASPRHGEQWGRHWLDVANYADTHGNDHDFVRPNAWPYRDYVIRAFNEDRPYARFIQEQVAGDALFPGDPEATVALGFLAASPWDHTLMVTVRADTVDHRMAQNLDRDLMVSSVIGTFQSLTIHCARCHDHKFDPISQRDYYSLQAVFAGVDRADRPFDVDPALHLARQRLLQERLSLETVDEGALARVATPEVSRSMELWESEWRRREEAWVGMEILGVVSTGGATLTRQQDGSWFAGGVRPDHDTYIVTARVPAGPLAGVRLEVLPDDRLPQHGPGRWENGNFHLTEFRAFLSSPGETDGGRAIPFARATADHDEGAAISAAQAIDGKPETHWGIHPRYGERHEAVFEPRGMESPAPGALLTLLLEHQTGAVGHGIGRFRLSVATNAAALARIRPLPPPLRALLETPAAERTPAQKRDLALGILRLQNRAALEALPAPRLVYAISRDFPPDGENFKPTRHPRPIHLLARGDLARPGEEVQPAALACLPGMSPLLAMGEGDEESRRRAALARWVSDDRNVLTWRSIVNRVWAHHFGRGLCDTPNDFGKMGGTPSHPELLDWLAVWFRDDAKGSIKALHRLILTSETWRQSTFGGQGMGVDPDNRLLWRQARERLTAEEVRDTLLALGGRLDLTMGGAPAVQFIDHGDATFNTGGAPAFLDYDHFDPDAPAARRRAVYRFLFRTVPDPFMDALDCPDGGAFTPVRGSSTTALQALALLNDPFVIRQSESIAARIAARCSTPELQAEEAVRLILLRPSPAVERDRLAAYVRRHGLANTCQLLVNSNEFLYLD